jgi:hypothetical protein
LDSVFVFFVDEEFVEADLLQISNETLPHYRGPKHEMMSLEIAQIVFGEVTLPLMFPLKLDNQLPPAQTGRRFRRWR